MKYSTLKELINMTDKETVRAFIDGDDMHDQAYTVMSESDTMDYIVNSYSDEYMLGCFNAWYIADNTNIPLKAVESLQKYGAYSELGELILSDTSVEKFLEDAIALDGVGHFVSSYDGNAEDIHIDGSLHYVWKN